MNIDRLYYYAYFIMYLYCYYSNLFTEKNVSTYVSLIFEIAITTTSSTTF